MSDLAQLAYAAYAKQRAYKTFDGSDMLGWDELGTDIQDGWDAAAQAVAHAIFDVVDEQGVER